MLSLETQLANLHQHEALVPIFSEQGLDAPWSLELVLVELGKLGEAIIGSHDEGMTENGVELYFICSLRWRGSVIEEPLVTGSGGTPTLAALRCLMEASYSLKRQVSDSIL